MPLNKLKHILVPQDNIFFELMERQAEVAHLSAQALYELLKNYENTSVKSKKIKDLEHEGDDLMRKLYTALNKTFIVPIDHEDISTLAGSLDDIIDLIDKVSTLMVIYEISTPSKPMVELAELLVHQTKELKSGVKAINQVKTYKQVFDHCNKIKQFEMQADEIYNKALGTLFKKNDAPLEIFKQKEILDDLEMATDKTDKASQFISDIVMKHS